MELQHLQEIKVPKHKSSYNSCEKKLHHQKTVNQFKNYRSNNQWPPQYFSNVLIINSSEISGELNGIINEHTIRFQNNVKKFENKISNKQQPPQDFFNALIRNLSAIKGE